MSNLNDENKAVRLPTFKEAITPIIFMVLVLAIGMGLLGWPTGVCLLISATCAGIIAVSKLNYSWEQIEKFVIDKFAAVMPACFIVILVGFMVATWSFSGTLPMMVYYGMEIIKPELVLVLSFVLTAILSYVSGNSWGSVASIGVALMGVGIGLGVDVGMLAAAIVTGAYFGDKLSPLSDTTNLASAVTKAPLYDHIKYMLWTTVPSTILALVFFLYLGYTTDSAGGVSESSARLLEQLASIYQFGFLPLVPMLVILVCTFIGKPAVPSMLLSSLAAVLVGWQYQGFDLINGVQATMDGFDVGMIGVDPATLEPEVLNLLNRGGLNNQGGFLAFIICAMAFAGILTGTRMMDVAMSEMTKKITTAKSAILGSGVICIVINMLTGSDGLNKVITTELMQRRFLQLKLNPLVLSRTLEDFGTMTGPAIPWTAAGLYMATTLGVPTMEYLPYCLLFFGSMAFATIYAMTGYTIKYMTDEEIAEFTEKHGIVLDEVEQDTNVSVPVAQLT